jgi:hypothetical protein
VDAAAHAVTPAGSASLRDTGRAIAAARLLRHGLLALAVLSVLFAAADVAMTSAMLSSGGHYYEKMAAGAALWAAFGAAGLVAGKTACLVAVALLIAVNLRMGGWIGTGCALIIAIACAAANGFAVASNALVSAGIWS